MTTIRTWSANYNDTLDPAASLINNVATFDVTVPMDYVPGDNIYFLFSGEVLADGAFPTSFEVDTDCGLTNIDGDWTTNATFSGTGYTYAAGQTLLSWFGLEDTWNTTGPLTGSARIIPTNDIGYLLVDLTPTYPGEGGVLIGGGMTPTPTGWDPSISPISTISGMNLNPGDHVSAEVDIQVLSFDDVNPTRSIYATYTRFALDFGATVLEIPLATVQTGFNLGHAGTVPWTDTHTAGGPWNARRNVVVGQPTQAGGAQDMYLIGAATQRTQGMIF